MVVVNGVEMVDVHEAARLVGRSAETIRRWVWAGRVAHLKQGNRLLIPRAELASTGHETSAPTFTDWLERRAQTHRTPRRGESAADLVLDDRAVRSGQRGGR